MGGWSGDDLCQGARGTPRCLKSSFTVIPTGVLEDVVMEAKIDEIGAGIYRLSIFVPDVAPPTGFTFNHFLFTGDEPLLFHQSWPDHGRDGSQPCGAQAEGAGHHAWLVIFR